MSSQQPEETTPEVTTPPYCEKKSPKEQQGTANQEEQSAETRSDDKLLDAAAALAAGDRLEVQWDIINDDNTTITRWWGATLLAYSGARLKSEDTQANEAAIAIRTLHYDAYPEGGFPESTHEDVIFLGQDKLLQLDNGQELNYRKEENKKEKQANTANVVIVDKNGQDEGIRQVLDGVLSTALSKRGAQFEKLDAASQAWVAGRVATAKEQLLQALSRHVSNNSDQGDITSDHVKSIIAETFGPNKKRRMA